eukprot:6374354-Alexandrium_andersonii.AAC.1
MPESPASCASNRPSRRVAVLAPRHGSSPTNSDFKARPGPALQQRLAAGGARATHEVPFT